MRMGLELMTEGGRYGTSRFDLPISVLGASRRVVSELEIHLHGTHHRRHRPVQWVATGNIKRKTPLFRQGRIV